VKQTDRARKPPRGASTLDATAQELLETVPALMRRIREESRRYRPRSLTVPQMRALGYIRRNTGTSLAPLAEHLGVTPPTASALVERLVRLDLVRREPDPKERRRAVLTISPEGKALFAWTTARIRETLRNDLRSLSPGDLDEIRRSLSALSGALGVDRKRNRWTTPSPPRA